MNESTIADNVPDSRARRGSRDPSDTAWPKVSGYEIVRELGRGGMGVVYEARELASERRVALKLIRDGALASPSERARFRIEAAAAARMQHAHIVKIHDMGEQEGRSYFAMELLEGGSLDQRLAGKPQPAGQAAHLVRTLALAVQHAHEQKIVHRDLKPANVLLVSGGVVSGEFATHDSPLTTPPLTSCIPKIADFGLAKRLDAESTAVTQEGDILGTASYMAPEQATGRVGAIGPGVDVYALGAILYETLTGRPPFQANTWNETVQMVIHDEPALPSRLQPDVPRDLEAICLKCLEKAAGRRYASALDLADDLGRFLESRPVFAAPVDEQERLTRRAARDGFQIVGAIGKSGHSVVYHAVDNPRKQPVALKVFPQGMCSQEQWETQLRRATEVWATLTHPQIVPVHRAGWWDGAAYLAVEYVPQGSLRDAFAGKPYPLAQALQLAEQLVEIVSYLHRQGVVHGNLKPSNVLLAANGIPRVVDLHVTARLSQGLRPALDADGATPFEDSGRATQRADVAYLAPELAGNAGAEPRPHTDIYGVGVVLYELLTGRPPFSAATAEATLELVRGQDPIAPSQYNRLVKPPLDAFCLHCLRKNPWRRFERAYSLLAHLRQFREDLGSDASRRQRTVRR
jgi:serine/threonine protein kinase